MSLEKHHLPMRAIDYLFGTPRACTVTSRLLQQLLRRSTASFPIPASLSVKTSTALARPAVGA